MTNEINVTIVAVDEDISNRGPTLSIRREEPEPDAEDQLSAFDEELQNLHLGGAVTSASDSESDDSSDG